MDEEKKQGGLTPEWEKAVDDMIERHYGIRPRKLTPEEDAEVKEILRLWKEYWQKEKQSKERTSEDMPTD